MKLFVQHAGLLDPQMLLSAGVELVEKAHRADVCVWITDMPYGDRRSAVMLYTEPPLSIEYEVPYKRPWEYRGCLLFGVVAPYDNVFPITEDPVVYPYRPDTANDLLRTDTTLRSRGVFFAGTRIGFPQGGEGTMGRVSLYATRNRLVEQLLDCGAVTMAEGVGWSNESRRIAAWDQVKLWKARACGADFHLCVENSILHNYTTEKLHHGFQSDLVVLYLGEPNIDRWVPKEAFIDLRPYYNAATRLVDAASVAKRLAQMTQGEYDDILGAAREWRRSDLLEERRQVQIERATKIVLGRL